MGGVGKTTIVKELIKTIEKSKLFDEVAMAVVSQDINYEKIQIQIVEGLSMEMKKVSLQGRAMQLLQRLSEGSKRVLIVLDDVWDILDFECIGLPNLEQHKHCKILFTSREKIVCQNMGCKVNIPVSVLQKDEAWYLFREMAGEIVDRPDINPIARDIANECGGLPFPIVTIGRALCNVGKYAWEEALRQLRNFQSPSLMEVEKFVYSSIELSLSSWTVKNTSTSLCFVDCFQKTLTFLLKVYCIMQMAWGCLKISMYHGKQEIKCIHWWTI
jgi:disease resistance protein RPS2